MCQDLLILLITASEERELFVSLKGTDSPLCGYYIPCRTIGYTLAHQARTDDIIKIDNEFSTEGKKYHISKSSRFARNLSLIGFNGKPIISGNTYLFEDNEETNLTELTLTVTSICFKGTSLIRIRRKPPKLTSVKVARCLITKGNDFISVQGSSRISSKPFVSITILDTEVHDCYSALYFYSSHVTLSIIRSTFTKYGYRGYDLSSPGTCARTYNVLSLSANLHSVTFINVVFTSYSRNIGVFTVNMTNSHVYADVNSYGKRCLSNLFVMRTGTAIVRNSTFKNQCRLVEKDKKPEYGIISIMSAQVTFDHCRFVITGLKNVAAINIDSDSRVKFNQSTFLSNKTKAVYIKQSRVQFENCTFREYSTVQKCEVEHGRAVSAYLSYTILSSCWFSNFCIKSSGSAVHILEGRANLENCYFFNNSAKEGGAVFIDTGHNISISQCYFSGNKAVDGGSIFHAGGILVITDTTFNTSSNQNHKIWARGDAIYSASKISMQNVSVNDMEDFSSQSLLIRCSTLGPTQNVKVHCSTGKTAMIRNNLDNTMDNYVDILCQSCPTDMYSLSSGNIMLQSIRHVNFRHNASHVKCFKCPFGGVCEKGHIRPANNFWGYLKAGEVRFVTCPSGYCCTGRMCKTYDSCSSGRQGDLCGSCGKGLTENVMTANCLDPMNCSHSWFWLVVFASGMFYIFVFMYLEEIFKFFKVILLPRGLLRNLEKRHSPVVLMKSFIFNDAESDCQDNRGYQCEDLHVQHEPNVANPYELSLEGNISSQEELRIEQCEDDVNGTNLTDGSLDEDANKQNTQHADESLTFFPGFFKIIVFFYQTNVLYKVYIMSEKSRPIFQITQEMLAAAFNLRADGLFYQDLSWCPFQSLNPVSKVIFKMSFIFFLIFLILTIHIFSQVLKKVGQNPAQYSHSLTQRIMQCSMRLILISYATITTGLFSLVSCIPLHNFERVLFIDGSIKCYQWWQYVATLVIACWVISFPMALYASSRLLHKRKITSKNFVLSLIFPSAVIMYWLYIRLCNFKSSKEESREESATPVAELESADDDSSQEGKISEVLLNVIEGPFRKSDEPMADVNAKLPWESVLVARRLVLILVKTVVFNTLVRLSVMLMVTILFLIHHMKVQPFSNPVLNYIETGSLFMLSVICGVNTIAAYNYMYPLSVSPFFQSLSKTFSQIETGLTLICPTFLVSFITMLLGIRLLQGICWLCHKMFVIIRSFIIRKRGG